jgi:hypothetical protein
VPRNTVGEDVVTTPGLTLDELFMSQELAHVDLLKIDIEGAEWDVLRRSECLDAVSRVVGEMHEMAGQESTDSFSPELRKHIVSECR